MRLQRFEILWRFVVTEYDGFILKWRQVSITRRKIFKCIWQVSHFLIKNIVAKMVVVCERKCLRANEHKLCLKVLHVQDCYCVQSFFFLFLMALSTCTLIFFMNSNSSTCDNKNLCPHDNVWGKKKKNGPKMLNNNCSVSSESSEVLNYLNPKYQMKSWKSIKHPNHKVRGLHFGRVLVLSSKFVTVVFS